MRNTDARDPTPLRAPAGRRPRSRAREAAGLLFLSGLTALGLPPADESSGAGRTQVDAEVARVIAALHAALAEQGLAAGNVVRLDAYVRDIADAQDAVAAFERHLGAQVPTTVHAVDPSGLSVPSATVELDVVVDTAGPVTIHRGRSDVPSDDEVVASTTSRGLVFLAGRMATEPGATRLARAARPDPDLPHHEDAVVRETEHVLAELAATLETVGSDPAPVVNAQVYLTQLEDFHAFDLAWSRTFPSPPPRTTVQAEALPSPDARVLVQLTAAAGDLEVVDVVTDEAPSPIANYTQARRTDGLLFAAGQLASDFVTGVPPEASIDPAFPFYGTTIEAQTRYVLDNIDAVLRAGGSGLDHVVKALVLLRDLDELSGLERVWRERFGDDPPARTSVELGGHGLLVRDARVEVYVIAATP